MKNEQLKNINNIGQGIIEIVITIGLVTIIILAIVSLSTRANKSASFSQDEETAKSISSQAIEIIRNIQANDLPGTLLDISCNDVSQTNVGNFNLIMFNNLANSNIDDSNNTSAICLNYGRFGVLYQDPAKCAGANYCLHFSGNDQAQTGIDWQSTAVPNNSRFSRKIYVADTPTTDTPPGKSKCNTTSDWNKVKQFTVEVSWTDSRGSHSVTDTTCLVKA